MLATAFQIHVGLEGLFFAAKFLALGNHRAGGGAGINPDIERVVGFCGCFRAFPIGRFESAPEFGGGFFKPNIGAMLLDQGGGVARDVRMAWMAAVRRESLAMRRFWTWRSRAKSWSATVSPRVRRDKAPPENSIGERLRA